MRYKLDASGYVCAVSFGCYLDDCTEYTGAIPTGYKTLDDWASNACIQAYYIDPNGNLVIDFARKTECENKQAQEAIDYAPLLRKDLYETDEVLDSQYVRQTATGKVIVLEDIKTIAPRVKITDIDPGCNKLSIYTQGRNMMPCHAVSCVIDGVTFTKNASGSITVLGTATKAIEYIVSDGESTPLFALKKNHNYYLNLGGLQCELRYYDGETTAQQYVGKSGLLNLPESIEVTQVVIKIGKGKTVNTTFYPQLEFGTAFTSYETHKCKSLEICFGENNQEILYPNNKLYAEDTLYPGVIYHAVDYIIIENGNVTISIEGEVHVLGSGSVGLFSNYNTIYATKDVQLEIEYSDNMIDVDSLAFLQGKSTTTNQFKILKDGSIEAHNGYFSGKIEADSGYFKGRIEADSGYFKGEISWENITDTENVATKNYVTGLGYQTASQVTKITKNTVTSAYINATVGLSANYATIKSLNAVSARVKTIEANYIKTSTVSANYATINSLDALSSRVGIIEANYITASIVSANYATINSLNAVSAKFNNLNANNITTGTLNTDRLDVQSIQSRFSESVAVRCSAVITKGVVINGVNYVPRSVIINGSEMSILATV